MLSEMPLTSRVLKVCQTWGTKLAVEMMAAIVPMVLMRVMALNVRP
jgi:hypothetical protein